MTTSTNGTTRTEPRNAVAAFFERDDADDWLFVCPDGEILKRVQMIGKPKFIGLLGTTYARALAPRFLERDAQGKHIVVVTPSTGPEVLAMANEVAVRYRDAGAMSVLEWPLIGLGGDEFPDFAAWSVRYDLAQAFGISIPFRAAKCDPPLGTNRHTNGSAPVVPYKDLSDKELGIIRAVDVVAANVDWLWPYRIAAGEMTVLAGEGGLGKSSVLLAIIAIVTRGLEWPDKSGWAPVGPAIIVSAEDSRETTLKPRLMALGADLDKIDFCIAKVKMRRKEGEEATINVQKSLQDLEYWKELVARRHPKVMMIDPIPPYLGKGVNDSRNLELRAVLEPFIEEVIRPNGIALLANTHLNKSVDSATPLHRISGNAAYGNLPRNAHFVVRDHADRKRRIFTQAKCNNADDELPSLAFAMRKTMVPGPDGLEIETACPVFEAETIPFNLQEAMGKKSHRGPVPQRTSEISLWLLDYLRHEDQPVRVRTVFEAAGAKGYVGELKENSEGHQRWTGVSTLYTAKDRVPQLPKPNDGWCIEACVDPDGRTVWQAVRPEAGAGVPF
jgi:hypothetical protein